MVKTILYLIMVFGYYPLFNKMNFRIMLVNSKKYYLLSKYNDGKLHVSYSQNRSLSLYSDIDVYVFSEKEYNNLLVLKDAIILYEDKVDNIQPERTLERIYLEIMKQQKNDKEEFSSILKIRKINDNTLRFTFIPQTLHQEYLYYDFQDLYFESNISDFNKMLNLK